MAGGGEIESHYSELDDNEGDGDYKIGGFTAGIYTTSRDHTENEQSCASHNVQQSSYDGSSYDGYNRENDDGFTENEQSWANHYIKLDQEYEDYEKAGEEEARCPSQSPQQRHPQPDTKVDSSVPSEEEGNEVKLGRLGRPPSIDINKKPELANQMVKVHKERNKHGLRVIREENGISPRILSNIRQQLLAAGMLDEEDIPKRRRNLSSLQKRSRKK
jgi:hypothetical protein